MPLNPPDLSTPPGAPDPRPSSPVRESLLVRFRDPEDAATVRRLGDLLYDLVNEAGQFGPEDDEATIRPALLAAAQDLLLDASNLTEVAAECRWNGALPEEEAQLADRIDAWAFQVQLLAGAILQTLGVETGEMPEQTPAPVDSRPSPERRPEFGGPAEVRWTR